MFALNKILLPVDFSERCEGAARYAEALAERFAAEVTILHVLPPPHYEFSAMEVGGTVLNELFANRVAEVENQVKDYLAEKIPQLKARRLILEGDPARKIVAFAHDEGFHLIVIPTHGYGPFRRFILGSVAAKILHDADCPVWTGVHLEQAPPVEQIDFHNVVAAVDLGDHSEKVIAWAAGFASAYQARLTVVHAMPSLEGKSGEYFDPDWRLHLGNQAKETIGGLLQPSGIEAEIFVESGDAPGVVCSAAETLRAGLLVIGRGSASGIFGRLRTNAYSIIRQSPCPVVSV